MKRFENRTAVITGAASGMGLLTSQKLAEEGANVLLCDISTDRVEQAAAEIRAQGGSALGLTVDVRNYADIDKAVKLAEEKFGGVDVTVSYAGGAPARMNGIGGTPFVEMPIEVLDWGVEVNFRAPMYMARAALPGRMARKRGVIINVGSVCGAIADPGNPDYSTEKSGVMNGLTRSIALLGAPYGVRCCAVAPGPVLTRAAMANMKTALGRAAEPIEVVKLVLYLCSDDAAFITGDCYLIDGGCSLLRG